MAALSPEQIGALLAPWLSAAPSPELCGSLSIYLDLLLRWNARVNLTAVRDPAEIVGRHFGESLALAERLPESGTLLDFGSGGGFPGVPVQLLRPKVRVTLAESQAKKAAFLAEAVRALAIGSRVWPRRVEDLPANECFDTVTMRAVDSSARMLPLAWARVAGGGRLALLQPEGAALPSPGDAGQASVHRLQRGGSWVLLTRDEPSRGQSDVPRGTEADSSKGS